MKRVLIIGAGGFIGGFIAAESLRRGYETWCGVRESTSRRFLTDERLQFLTLDYDDPESLAATLSGCGKWDYIIYNLGATKCVNFGDFNRINFKYLRDFIKALRAADKVPGRFIYMSSLSALGPGDEKNYTPLSDDMLPQPDTRYGLSKVKAETELMSQPDDFPWIILRPTGVYGPHEQDYLMMIKMIDSHWDFGVGFRKQMLTFIYVEDLARAIFDAAEHAPLHRRYIVSEPKAYSQAEFRRIVCRHLGRSFAIPVRLPLWMVKIASAACEKYGVAKNQPTTLNRDKFNIMKQRNWSCDISPAVNDWGFAPRVSLDEGIAATVKAYRAEQEQERLRRKEEKKERRQEMTRPADTNPPFWVKLLIFLLIQPVFLIPSLLSQLPPDHAEWRTIIWCFPFYLLLSGWLAWITYNTRPVISWILMVLMVMSTVAMEMLVKL